MSARRASRSPAPHLARSSSTSGKSVRGMGPPDELESRLDIASGNAIGDYRCVADMIFQKCQFCEIFSPQLRSHIFGHFGYRVIWPQRDEIAPKANLSLGGPAGRAGVLAGTA